jgi:MSHA biogenesis protein MshJ
VAIARKTRLQPWLERVDALDLRERILLMAAGVAAMFLLVDTFLLQPALQAQQVTGERIAGLEVKLNGLRQNARLLTFSDGDDLLQTRRNERDRLQAELHTLDARMVSQLDALVDPVQAARILEQLLANFAGLQLTALTASTEPLNTPAQDSGAGAPGLARYRVDMVISGGYMEILRYLQKLETLPWQFFWQQINFQSTGYPAAETRLQLYTLGTDHG